MTLEDFLALLSAVAPGKHPTEASVKTWAEYVSDVNPRFVAPPLREQRPAVADQTSTVILSAPGAVGKSTLGKEIARSRQAPLVNLAERLVGTDGAAGLLTNMFGFARVSSAFSDFADGSLFLVIDALDETRLGSGDANFDAFLGGLANLLKAPRKHPSVVLLARTDTAEWIELLLDSIGVPVAHYVIDFFDDTTAKEFVDRYVTERSKGTVVTSDLPFMKARDELLGGIRNAVGAEAEQLVRSVLGYAPVLEAVGEYLLDDENRRNYHRLLQALQRGAREWELLLQVAEAVLRREQGKLARQLKERLQALAGATWSAWEALYTPDEQFERLLARRFKLPQPALPPDLPARFRLDYETAVMVALNDHPFGGSVDGLHALFGEYLYARLFAGEQVRTASLTQRARDILRSATYLPTRALARFVHALTSRAGEPRVEARDLGFIYESALSDHQKPGDVRLLLRSSGDEDVRAWISVRGSLLQFRLMKPEPGIWLWRRLSHASISVATHVELGYPGGDFRLGPAVDLECSMLLCPAQLHVYLGSDKDGDEVALVAETFGEMARRPSVKGERFYVSGESVVWPWKDYERRESPPPRVTREVTEAYNHLARILLWFRAEGYDEIARVNDLVENAATGGTPTAKRLLEFCVQKGLIHRGKLYKLDDDKLARYEINYVDLTRRTLKGPVIELLTEFLRTHRSG